MYNITTQVLFSKWVKWPRIKQLRESEKQAKCFPSSESTCSVSSETSISCQPIQKRSTCMIQVSKDLSMTINDFHEKLTILLKSIWHYSFIKRHGHS